MQTIHGLDGERAKWGRVAQTILNVATWMSARVPDETITVSSALADHYSERYGRSCSTIVNGVTPRMPRPAGLIRTKYGLDGGDYMLFVGRLVPEKRPDLLIKAFAELDTDARLVIAGGSSYTDDYVEELRRLAARDDRVIMPGYVYGEELDELYTNARALVQPSALEGLPLTLLEAMGSGTPVVASDIAPHREVIGRSRVGARLFADGDLPSLVEALQLVDKDPAAERGPRRRSAVRRPQVRLGRLPSTAWKRSTPGGRSPPPSVRSTLRRAASTLGFTIERKQLHECFRSQAPQPRPLACSRRDRARGRIRVVRRGHRSVAGRPERGRLAGLRRQAAARHGRSRVQHHQLGPERRRRRHLHQGPGRQLQPAGVGPAEAVPLRLRHRGRSTPRSRP